MTSKGVGMMRKGILLIGAMAVIALAGAAWAAPPPPTPAVPLPRKGAALYKTTFVHAMKACDPTDVSAITLHVKGPAGGRRDLFACQVQPSDFAPQWFDKAQLVLGKKSGKITLHAQGLPPGQQVALGLTLRSSRESSAGVPIKAWEGQCLTGCDVVYLPLNLVCPPVIVDPKGKIVQKTNLDQCVPLPGGDTKAVDPLAPPPPGGSEEKGIMDLNIEVVDATLITASGVCVGGSTPGAVCTVLAPTCPSIAAGTCPAGVCVGGIDPGNACTGAGDCPGSAGVCTYSGPAFGRAGIAR